MSAPQTEMFADDDNRLMRDDDFVFAQNAAKPVASIDEPATFATPPSPDSDFAASHFFRR